MKVRAKLLLALVLTTGAAAGCGRPVATTPAAIPQGSSLQTIDVDGTTRQFRVYRPARLSGPTPLVLVLHGWGFTAAQIERDYGWNDVADKHRFVVVYPQGLERSWNAAGACCGPAAERQVDDVAFITTMIDRLSQALPVDDQRIYAAGMSNGGVFAYALACRTTHFAAISAVAATQVGACQRPRPTSVLHVHGLADPLVRYNGSAAIVPGAQPVPVVVGRWLRINRCQPPQQSRDGRVAIGRAACAHDREVMLVVIAGEGHTWPGRAGSRAPWDTTGEVWTFFSRHSLQ